MKVRVKTLTGKEYEVELEPETSLQGLREKLNDKTGIPTDQQRIAVLKKEELDALPFSSDKMNGIVEEYDKQKRFLAGRDKTCSELGIEEATSMLLSLSLSHQDDVEITSEEYVSTLSHRVVFEDYKVTLQEMQKLANHMRALKPTNDKFDRLTTSVGQCLCYCFNPKPEYVDTNLSIVKDAIEMLKTNTDQYLCDALLSVVTGAAKANIDGLILKMLDMGLLDTLKKFLATPPATTGQPHSDYDDTVYSVPHARTKLQLKVIETLEAIQENHEPVKAQIADIIYGEYFRKEGVLLYPNHGFNDYTPEKYLWEDASKIYTAEPKIGYNIKILAFSGRELAAKDSNGLSDPFFLISQTPGYKEKAKVQIKSATIKKTLNPVWDISKEKNTTAKFESGETCLVQVYDEDLLGSDFMGSVTLNPKILYSMQKSANKDSVTLIGKPESIESTTKGSKFRDVSGFLTIKMTISK